MTINRRFPPSVPADMSHLPYETNIHAIEEFMRWMFEGYSGVPGGAGEIIGTTPPAVIVGDAADGSPGTQEAGWMAADAQLVVESAAPSGLANANAEGSAETVSRSDHQHKRDVRVAANGSDVGTRNRLNFVAPSGIVSDDAGNDEVDVNLSTLQDDALKLAFFWAQVF